ncbi:MAG TPA: hypothetical protein VGF59_31600 [Bryobacteraceae bacterium]|jgi:hypothetical protein
MKPHLDLEQRLTALAAEIDEFECAVCLGNHNEAIHASGAGLRHWLREEIQRRLEVVHAEARMPSAA